MAPPADQTVEAVVKNLRPSTFRPLVAFVLAACLVAPASAQQVFKTPEDAAAALLKAVKSGNQSTRGRLAAGAATNGTLGHCLMRSRR